MSLFVHLFILPSFISSCLSLCISSFFPPLFRHVSLCASLRLPSVLYLCTYNSHSGNNSTFLPSSFYISFQNTHAAYISIFLLYIFAKHPCCVYFYLPSIDLCKTPMLRIFLSSFYISLQNTHAAYIS